MKTADQIIAEIAEVLAEMIDGSGFEKLTDGQVFSISPSRNK